MKYTFRACSKATKQICDFYDVASNLAAPPGESRAVRPQSEYYLIPGSLTWGKYTRTFIPHGPYPSEHQIRIFGIDINETNAERLLLKMKECIDVKKNKYHYVCTFTSRHYTKLACNFYQQGDLQITAANGESVLRKLTTEMVSEIPAPQERADIVDQLEAHKDIEAHSAPKRIIMEDAIHGAPMPKDIANNLTDISSACLEAENEYSNVLAKATSPEPYNEYLPTLREFIESLILRGQPLTVWGIAAIMLRRPSQTHMDAIRLIFEYIPARGNALTLSSDDIIECLQPEFLKIDPNRLSVAQELDAYYFLVTSKRRVVDDSEIHRLHTCIYRDFLHATTQPRYHLLRDSNQRTTPPQMHRRTVTAELARGIRSYMSTASSAMVNVYMQTKTCLRFLRPWGNHCARPWEDLNASSTELSERENRITTSGPSQALHGWPNTLSVHQLSSERIRSLIRSPPANMVTQDTNELDEFFSTSRDDYYWSHRNYRKHNLQWTRLRNRYLGKDGQSSIAVCALAAAANHQPDRTHPCDRVLHTVRNNMRMLQPMYQSILNSHSATETCWRIMALDIHKKQWDDATIRYNVEEQELGAGQSSTFPRVIINPSMPYSPPYATQQNDEQVALLWKMLVYQRDRYARWTSEYAKLRPLQYLVGPNHEARNGKWYGHLGSRPFFKDYGHGVFPGYEDHVITLARTWRNCGWHHTLNLVISQALWRKPFTDEEKLFHFCNEAATPEATNPTLHKKGDTYKSCPRELFFSDHTSYQVPANRLKIQAAQLIPWLHHLREVYDTIPRYTTNVFRSSIFHIRDKKGNICDGQDTVQSWEVTISLDKRVARALKLMPNVIRLLSTTGTHRKYHYLGPYYDTDLHESFGLDELHHLRGGGIPKPVWSDANESFEACPIGIPCDRAGNFLLRDIADLLQTEEDIALAAIVHYARRDTLGVHNPQLIPLVESYYARTPDKRDTLWTAKIVRVQICIPTLAGHIYKRLQGCGIFHGHYDTSPTCVYEAPPDCSLGESTLPYLYNEQMDFEIRTDIVALVEPVTPDEAITHFQKPLSTLPEAVHCLRAPVHDPILSDAHVGFHGLNIPEIDRTDYCERIVDIGAVAHRAIEHPNGTVVLDGVTDHDDFEKLDRIQTRLSATGSEDYFRTTVASKYITTATPIGWLEGDLDPTACIPLGALPQGRDRDDLYGQVNYASTTPSWKWLQEHIVFLDPDDWYDDARNTSAIPYRPDCLDVPALKEKNEKHVTRDINKRHRTTWPQMQRTCPACTRRAQQDPNAKQAGHQAAEFTYCIQCGATFIFVDLEYNVVVPRYGINFSDLAYTHLWKNFPEWLTSLPGACKQDYDLHYTLCCKDNARTWNDAEIAEHNYLKGALMQHGSMSFEALLDRWEHIPGHIEETDKLLLAHKFHHIRKNEVAFQKCICQFRRRHPPFATADEVEDTVTATQAAKRRPHEAPRFPLDKNIIQQTQCGVDPFYQSKHMWKDWLGDPTNLHTTPVILGLLPLLHFEQVHEDIGLLTPRSWHGHLGSNLSTWTLLMERCLGIRGMNVLELNFIVLASWCIMTDPTRGTGQKIPINHPFGTDDIRKTTGIIGNRIYEGDLVEFFRKELFDGTDTNYWGNMQPGTRYWVKQCPINDTPEQTTRGGHGWPLCILNHDYRHLKEASELDYVYNMIQPVQRWTSRTSRDDPRPAYWSFYQRALARATKRDQVKLKVFPRPRGETRTESAYPPLLTTVVKQEIKSEIKSEPSDSPPTGSRPVKRRHDDSQTSHTTDLRNIGRRLALRRSNAVPNTYGSETAPSRGVKRTASAPPRRLQTRKVLNIALSTQLAKCAQTTRITEIYIFTTVHTNVLVILAGIILALGVLALMVHNGGPNANTSRLSNYRRQIVHYVNNRIAAARRFGASFATASHSSITSTQATPRSSAETPLLETEAIDIKDQEDVEAAMLAMTELGNAIAGRIAASHNTDQNNAPLPEVPHIPSEEHSNCERILELLFQDIAYTTEQYRISRIRRDQAIQNGFQALRSSILGVRDIQEAVMDPSSARSENDTSHFMDASSGLLVENPPQEEQQRNVRQRKNPDSGNISTPTARSTGNIQIEPDSVQNTTESTIMDRPPLARFSTLQQMAHCSPDRSLRCVLTRPENEARVVESFLSSTSRSGEHFRNLSDDRWRTNIINQGLHQPQNTSIPRNTTPNGAPTGTQTTMMRRSPSTEMPNHTPVGEPLKRLPLNQGPPRQSDNEISVILPPTPCVPWLPPPSRSQPLPAVPTNILPSHSEIINGIVANRVNALNASLSTTTARAPSPRIVYQRHGPQGRRLCHHQCTRCGELCSHSFGHFQNHTCNCPVYLRTNTPGDTAKFWQDWAQQNLDTTLSHQNGSTIIIPPISLETLDDTRGPAVPITPQSPNPEEVSTPPQPIAETTKSLTAQPTGILATLPSNTSTCPCADCCNGVPPRQYANTPEDAYVMALHSEFLASLRGAHASSSTTITPPAPICPCLDCASGVAPREQATCPQDFYVMAVHNEFHARGWDAAMRILPPEQWRSNATAVGHIPRRNWHINTTGYIPRLLRYLQGDIRCPRCLSANCYCDDVDELLVCFICNHDPCICMWSDASSEHESNRSTTLTHAPSSDIVDGTDTASFTSFSSPAPSTIGPATPPRSTRDETSPRTGTPPTNVSRLVHYQAEPDDDMVHEFPFPADVSPTDSEYSEEIRLLQQEEAPMPPASPPSWLRQLEEEDDCYGC